MICPYCKQEIPSKDFAAKTPQGNYWHFNCADSALDDWMKAKETLQAINDLTVNYQEEGPFTEQEAFDRVTRIYELSLREG